MTDLQLLLNTLQSYKNGEYPQCKNDSGFCVYQHNGNMCVIGRYLDNKEYDISNLEYNLSIETYIDQIPEISFYFNGIPIEIIQEVQDCHDNLSRESFTELYNLLIELEAIIIPKWLEDIVYQKE